MALLVVLISVAVLMLMSLTFVAVQGTTSGMARNIQHHAQASLIAESGLAKAISEIRTNRTWRKEFSHAPWVPHGNYAGGTFTIHVEDGQDIDRDGLISVSDEGDGEIANDPSNALTLTAIGHFEGVTHRVRPSSPPRLRPQSSRCS